MGKLTKEHFKNQIGYDGYKRNIDLYYFVSTNDNHIHVEHFNINDNVPNVEYISHKGDFPLVKIIK